MTIINRMHQEYTKTFLNITSKDIEDFMTIRRRFDKPFQYQVSVEEKTNLLFDYETELKIEEVKYSDSIKDKQTIDKEIDEINQTKLFNKQINQPEKFITFPYKSFLNLRHWHKAPKTLKTFFQALACLFPISNPDFLTELKVNHQLLEIMKLSRPSSILMDEFRMKYFNSKELSLEYIRHKSLDAYSIAIWMYNIEENERLNRIKQVEIENEKQFQKKLIQLDINHSTKQKEIQLIENKIRTLKQKINQLLHQSN